MLGDDAESISLDLLNELAICEDVVEELLFECNLQLLDVDVVILVLLLLLCFL
jgi:hypothetical protein